MVAAAQKVAGLKFPGNALTVLFRAVIYSLADQLKPAQEMGQGIRITVNPVKQTSIEILIGILGLLIEPKTVQQRHCVFRAFILKQAPSQLDDVIFAGTFLDLRILKRGLVFGNQGVIGEAHQPQNLLVLPVHVQKLQHPLFGFMKVLFVDEIADHP